jgi:drug/metabolite transporter (DMT)-like permease
MALNFLGASRNAIISCLFSPFVILLSFTFLGERFTFVQSLGFLLVLIGIFLAVYQKAEDKIDKRALVVGTITGIISIFFMATGMVITKPIATDAPAITVAWIRLTGGVGGVLIYTMIRGQLVKSLHLFKSPLPWKIILSGAFVGSYLALLTWILGFKYTNASTASILNQTSVIFILLLAAFFLKERLRPQKILATVLSFAGVIIIFINA